ncbi:MAG: hydroxyethylthiazole kinase [Rhodobiaceae bacterium]|nr:hydroxyethylthiazole kinase [Rhodobiaceae bacterium]MCC0055733.1 hydroxyethylthiazole kinase [Rhodobiaceae bacterium]
MEQMTIQTAVEQAAQTLERLREEAPSVHCLTNTVAQAFTANCCLALGLRPSMTDTANEVAYFVRDARALLINLGTLAPERRETIGIAVDLMRDEQRPWVLDPVFVDVSEPRAAFARELTRLQPAIIRGNANEITALAPTGDDPVAALAVEAMTTVMCTGAVDRIVAGRTQIEVLNGTPLLAQVTATGCAGAAITAAFAAIEPDMAIASLSSALVMGIAGEMAAREASGPGSFAMHLVDRLSTIRPEDLTNFARARR